MAGLVFLWNQGVQSASPHIPIKIFEAQNRKFILSANMREFNFEAFERKFTFPAQDRAFCIDALNREFTFQALDRTFIFYPNNKEKMEYELQSFYKQSGESYGIAFDFTNKLPEGAAIDSVAVSAIIHPNGASASATVLDSTTGGIDGSKATAGVKAGTSGITYKITFLVTLDNSGADVLEEDILMIVKDV